MIILQLDLNKDQNRLLDIKENERIKTENSNITYDHPNLSPKFPMSDTFFGQMNANKNHQEVDSAKAMAPMTYTNVSSDDMIEDSMNIDLNDPRDQVFDDYNKFKYQREMAFSSQNEKNEIYKLKRDLEQLQNKYKQVQILL